MVEFNVYVVTWSLENSSLRGIKIFNTHHAAHLFANTKERWENAVMSCHPVWCEPPKTDNPSPHVRTK